MISTDERSCRCLPLFTAPRKLHLSDYYRCVEDYFGTFVGIYDEYFSRQYGFRRPYIEQAYRYLDCDDFHNGFARS
ncbi:MAG: hypothetical protein NTY86_13600 [Deltaproteobacteria bacterium]|nr:hypothetical protein [Deltaproteobacteria bacterium]